MHRLTLRSRTPGWHPTLVVLALTLGLGCQTTLSAKVSGSRSPSTKRCTPGERLAVENGDFTIVQSCVDPHNDIVGDGIAEVVSWEFDLSDEAFAGCYPEAAFIDMKLKPTGDLLGESLRVENRWAMGLEEIQSLDVGDWQDLSVDMMTRNGRPSPYTPSAIRDLLIQSGGVLPMTYELNALIRSAELSLLCRK